MEKIFSIPVEDIFIENVNNTDFLKLKIYAISNTINRNNVEFLSESFAPSIKTIYNKPILAYYNEYLNDTEGHNFRVSLTKSGEEYDDYDYSEAEKAVGVIPESANIHIEHKDGKDWVVVEGACIWTQYNRKLSELILDKGRKRVSVEVGFVEYETKDGIDFVSLWNFHGITILGKTSDGREILEGIEGAHLSVQNFSKSKKFEEFKKSFYSAADKTDSDVLKKFGVIMSSEKSENKYGNGESIEVDKSKESISNDAWGDIDKTTLRSKVLSAKNYGSIVHSVYLLVEDGWKDSPSEHLKYPVMQYKGGKFVYNSGGLLSAQQYGEKNDESIAKKALSIRKKLGLIKSDKEEKMKEFMEEAKKSGFAFLGSVCGKFVFAKETEACDVSENETMSFFMIDKESAENFKAEDKFELAEDKRMEVSFVAKKETDPDDKEKKDLEAKVETLSKENEALTEKCAAAEKEAKEIRMEKFVSQATEFMNREERLSAKDKEEITSMCKDAKFSTVEELKKEVAYRVYSVQDDKQRNTFSYNFGNQKKNETKNSLIDSLREI